MLAALDQYLKLWRNRGPSPARPGEMDDGIPFVVITGATEGIGAALADVFAGAGHNILLVARSPDHLSRRQSELRSAHSVQIESIAADLVNHTGRRAIADRLHALSGYGDILVNNAADGMAGPFAHADKDALARLLALNIEVPTELMHTFLPAMLKRGRGGILNVSSLGGMVPGPYQAAYYASKAHMNSLTRAIRHECVGCGVRISVLAPGPVKTGFHARMDGDSAYYLRVMGVMNPHQVARTAYRGFIFGRAVIIPGLVHNVIGLALSILPHSLLVPIVGWMLKPRIGRSRSDRNTKTT